MMSESNDYNHETPHTTAAQSESIAKEDSKPIPAEKSKAKESAFQRFMRTALTWLIVAAVAFLAGVLTLYFVSYQPLNAALTKTQNELAEANQSMDDLEARLVAADKQVSTLIGENEAIQTELEAVKAHFGILQVLVDVTTARLALVNDDAATAKAALAETTAKLDALIPDITEVDVNLAESMPKRLTLILSGLDNDLDTAKTDLELLSGNLLSVETLLFGEE